MYAYIDSIRLMCLIVSNIFIYVNLSRCPVHIQMLVCAQHFLRIVVLTFNSFWTIHEETMAFFSKAK